LFELESDDLKKFDAIIDAFGMLEPRYMDQHYTSLEHLVKISAGFESKFYVVGGAGSLFVDNGLKIQFKDTKEFPEEYKTVADYMSKGLDVLRKTTDVHWVYVSPADFFDPDGPRINTCGMAGEKLVRNSKGKSYISYADYSIGLLDVIESGNVDKTRISLYTE